MTLMPTFLAGTNWVMHTAGWLEGGLVAGFEKFVIDCQIVEMLQHEFTPLEIDPGSLAFDAHQEVGHGGRHQSGGIRAGPQQGSRSSQ